MIAVLAIFAATHQPLKCEGRLLYPVAEDEAAAKRIVMGAIASRPRKALPSLFEHPGTPTGEDGQPYTLEFSLTEDGTGWNVAIYTTPSSDGTRRISPVYAMSIDRCSGAVGAFTDAF